MEIKFQKNSENYLKHTINKIKKDKSIKKRMIIIRIIIIILFLIPCMYKLHIDTKYIGEVETESYALIFLYLLCGVIWCFLLPSILYKVYSMIKTKQLDMLGGQVAEETNITVNDEELIEENEYSKIIAKWSEVTEIKHNKKRVLIKIKGLNDIYISADSFKDKESKDAFINFINEKINSTEKSVLLDDNKKTENDKEMEDDDNGN